ncbi:hypothetical protein J2X31_003552 [Flavobacterium arsenatis]|uniref:Uncharacterized protein n=1 Tax=Flavobacterium arsenatis TaxID=1484332 RepID=A0ABU1TUG2_9FLAO|nr:hypothetical protein [Flavobacterium arsenatis]
MNLRVTNGLILYSKKKMKTNNIIVAISFLFISSLKAQVLYSENFENYFVGDVGSDSSGQTSGQGGWFTSLF